ncbi:ABC transporter ATP-binding protein [Arthrobacter dokdonensis]|uniref:ABC transporter ATP-binding protein n=1 Tax=Arthrobacter dokdonellae TaxID=2211210 RepID=UPI001D13264B|nr:ABC transporter ATP-binding protein [Arthrobacter dokdonellae]
MRYGTKVVLNDVTFQTCHGQVLALLGPNGAGKTTTIEILEGFRVRSAGRVSVLGTDPVRGGEGWRSRLGIVLQSWRDHPKWRVRELLAYQGSYYTPYGTESVVRPWGADNLLAAVGLSGQAHTQVRMLSGGQRRRLDVAIGLVGRPELLFLDEPTAGLDPQGRRDFHDLIREVTERFETTILITTHDLDEAEKLADRIIILSGGRIIADGTPTGLAQEILGRDEVRWSLQGEHFREFVSDSTGFVRGLFTQHGYAIRDLEVRRASLEDTYLSLVRRAEKSPDAWTGNQAEDLKGTS